MIPDMLEIDGNILLDVTKQLKLKFSPLFEKPRRPNLHRFDLRFVAPSPSSYSKGTQKQLSISRSV